MSKNGSEMTHQLDSGVRYAVALVGSRLASGKSAFLLCAGGSASGKTSQVAEKISAAFPGKAVIFSLDNYYKGLLFMQAEWARGNPINYDQPEALDLLLAKEHILCLLRGERVPKFIYDFKTGLRSQEGWIEPAQVLIVEGLFALTDLFMDLESCDLRIFVDIGTHGRFVRRLLRDVERTSWPASDIIKYFAQITEPMHQQYIETSKRNAGIVIDNEYHAKEECRTGLVCQHLKFRKALDSDTLWHLGAERLGSFLQEDTYLNPVGKNLLDSDEMVRIRREGQQRVFSYIGPRDDSGFKKRRKVGPFEISSESVASFNLLYASTLRQIRKTRTLYLLPEGVLVGVDFDALCLEKGQENPLGPITELRFTGHMTDVMIRLIVSRLGLDIEEAILDSYAEIPCT